MAIAAHPSRAAPRAPPFGILQGLTSYLLVTVSPIPPPRGTVTRRAYVHAFFLE